MALPSIVSIKPSNCHIYTSLWSGNDQLKKKVLEPGEGRDSRPQKGQNVKINLMIFLRDGTPIEEQPNLSFTLGDGDVIQVLITHLWHPVTYNSSLLIYKEVVV